MEHALGRHTFEDYSFEDIVTEGEFTVYRLRGSHGEGEGEMRCYEALPGILVTYDRLEMQSCYQKVAPKQGYLQLNHCCGGCFEFALESGQICFMSKGDLCVSDPWSQHFVSSRLPVGHYEGLSIILEMEKAQRSIDACFPQLGICLCEIQAGLFQKDTTHLIRAGNQMEHIFAELYRVDERIRGAYTALKVMEALLFLRLGMEEPQVYLPQFSQGVVTRTKRAYDFLMESPSRKVTVRALAERCHIGESALQQCFKSIYGQPVAAFMRKQRIEESARMLRQEVGLSVGEIAQRVGYENQSKFAAAFKAVMGQGPMAYRHRNAQQVHNEMERN